MKLAANRLSKEAWLDHGLKELARAGPGALKADRLAKSLNVTRGSFYWHFKDLADFHSALLARWRTLMTDRVIAYVDEEAPRAGRLRLLMRRAFAGDDGAGDDGAGDDGAGDDGLERAIRSWAAHDLGVRKTVAQVDRVRAGYLEKLFLEAGVAAAEANARARFLYWAYLGRLMVGDETLGRLQMEELDGLASLLRN